MVNVAAVAQGTQVGRYVVLSKLGEGAMGFVYRAHDPELDREVAVKIVAGRQSARTAREGKALARLAHPNVVAVHDVGVHEDSTFVAMELVEGQTLKDWLSEKRTREEIVAMFAAAGRGLAAAHEAGVVHRDFKPTNVLVGRDGRPRVADFGLALAGAAAEGPSLAVAGAHEGVDTASTGLSAVSLVGTPRYVAPEQARGEETGPAADQFSFCVSLWEALCGEPPFEGRELLEILAAVRAGRFRESGSRIPEHTRRVLLRGLAEDPSRRYPSMAALLDDLERDPRASRRRAVPATALAAGGLGILAAIGAAFYAARAPSSVPSFHPAHVRRVTFSDGCEEFPSFTPDGKRVVFDEVRGTATVVAALDLASGTERAITDGTGSDFAAEVSPDGTQVAFLRAPSAGTPAAMVVDIDGKRPPRLVREGWVRPTFSPDGSALWCGDTHHPARVELATGNTTRTLDMPSGTLGTIARELRDGRVVLVAPVGEPTSLGGLALFESTGSLRWLTKDDMEEALDVTPDGRFVIASRVTPAGSDELIAVPLAGGAALAVGRADIAPSQGFRIAPDRSRIAWSNCHDVTSLVRVNEQGAFVPLHEAHAWKESAAAPIPGTRKLVVLSERDGENAPWIVDRDDREPPRKLPVTGSPLTLSVSPDGRLVALEIAEQGIVLVPIDGGSARRLTSDPADAKAHFLRDGHTIVFVRSGATPRVFAVDASGGEARPLLGEGSSDPAPSPVDDRIAYLSGTELTRKIPMIFDPRTGRSARLSPDLGEESYGPMAFTGDGRRIGILAGAAGNQIVEVDATTGAVLRTINAGASTLYRLAYDGNDPIVGRSQWVGNIWVADGPF
jgi:hypothetical protein